MTDRTGNQPDVVDHLDENAAAVTAYQRAKAEDDGYRIRHEDLLRELGVEVGPR